MQCNAMQCFSIPISLLKEIETICRNFFWGVEKRGKEDMLGGVGEVVWFQKRWWHGFQKLQVFNKAMLANQSWRVMNKKRVIVKLISTLSSFFVNPFTFLNLYDSLLTANIFNVY